MKSGEFIYDHFQDVFEKYPRDVLSQLIPDEFDKVLKKQKEKDEANLRNEEYDDS
jgi:hypothetical protein